MMSTDVVNDSSNELNEESEYLQFPINAVQERLQQANISRDVVPTAAAAVYTSAVLQYLTSKIISEAVKSIDDAETQTTNKKRKRSMLDTEALLSSEHETDECLNNNEQPQSNSIIDAVSSPPTKKRRICPKDISRALQRDAALKQFSHSIQNSSAAAENAVAMPQHDNDDACLSNLHGVIIAVEGLFEIDDAVYAHTLRQCLQKLYAQYSQQQSVYKHIFHHEPIDDKDRSSQRRGTDIKSIVISESISRLLENSFMQNPSVYAFPWLYHVSTIMSQQILRSASDDNHRPFIILNKSPIHLLSMAMLFMNRKYLSHEQFRLYLHAHEAELFPVSKRPDICVFAVPSISPPQTEYVKHDSSDGGNNPHATSSVHFMDDFLFELVIKKLASRKHGKHLFFREHQVKCNMPMVAQTVIDVLQNKRNVCEIFWESDLKAFNNTQNPNIVNPNKRMVYDNEQQIMAGIEMMQQNRLQKCDIVYIHICLWMKPRKKVFKQLIYAHLCRFESICFYALRHYDLDDRNKQIVQWIFAK